MFNDCTEGKGPVVTRELNLDEFNSLQLSGSDKMYISQGAEQEVLVEGQQNVIDRIDLTVSNGFWNTRTRGCLRRYEQLVYFVTLPEINHLSLTGSGEIIVENTVESTNLEIKVTGSGSIKADVDADVDCEITGSGEIFLSGNSGYAEVDLTGSGTYDSFGLETDQVEVTIQGSGDAYVTALEKLNVRITGSGNVYYKGNPLINSSGTGSGKLISRN